MNIPDVLGHVARFLPPQTLWDLKQVSSSFRRAIDSVTQRWCIPFFYHSGGVATKEAQRFDPAATTTPVKAAVGYIIFSTGEVIICEPVSHMLQSAKFDKATAVKAMFNEDEDLREVYTVRPYFFLIMDSDCFAVASKKKYSPELVRSLPSAKVIEAVATSGLPVAEFGFSTEGDHARLLQYPDAVFKPQFVYDFDPVEVSLRTRQLLGEDLTSDNIPRIKRRGESRLIPAIVRSLYLTHFLKSKRSGLFRVAQGRRRARLSELQKRQADDADHVNASLLMLKGMTYLPFCPYWHEVCRRMKRHHQQQKSRRLISASAAVEDDEDKKRNASRSISKDAKPDELMRSFASFFLETILDGDLDTNLGGSAGQSASSPPTPDHLPTPTPDLEQRYPTLNVQETLLKDDKKTLKWKRVHKRIFCVFDRFRAANAMLPTEAMVQVGTDRFGRKVRSLSSHVAALSRTLLDEREEKKKSQLSKKPSSSSASSPKKKPVMPSSGKRTRDQEEEMDEEEAKRTKVLVAETMHVLHVEDDEVIALVDRQINGDPLIQEKEQEEEEDEESSGSDGPEQDDDDDGEEGEQTLEDDDQEEGGSSARSRRKQTGPPSKEDHQQRDDDCTTTTAHHGQTSCGYDDKSVYFRTYYLEGFEVLKCPSAILQAEPWRKDMPHEVHLTLGSGGQTVVGNTSGEEEPIRSFEAYFSSLPAECRYPRYINSMLSGSFGKPYQTQYSQWLHILGGSFRFFVFDRAASASVGTGGEWVHLGVRLAGTTLFLPPFTPLVWVSEVEDLNGYRQNLMVVRKFIDEV